MMSLQLTIRRGDQRFDLALEPGDYFVGRAKSSDVRIPLNVVSSRHLRLQHSELGWTVTDLESTNGTLLGDAALTPHDPVVISAPITAQIGEIDIDFVPGLAPDSITLTETGLMTRQLVAEAILASTESSARVTVKAGPEASKVFNLESAPFLVGSSEHAQISLPGPQSVFSILRHDEFFWLSVDVSPAAVFVNGKPLKTPRVNLGAREVIKYQDVKLIFEDPLAELLKDTDAASPGITRDSEPPEAVKVAAARMLKDEPVQIIKRGPNLLWLVLAGLLFALAAAGLGYVATL